MQVQHFGANLQKYRTLVPAKKTVTLRKADRWQSPPLNEFYQLISILQPCLAESEDVGAGAYKWVKYLCKNLEVKEGRGFTFGRIQYCNYLMFIQGTEVVISEEDT